MTTYNIIGFNHQQGTITVSYDTGEYFNCFAPRKLKVGAIDDSITSTNSNMVECSSFTEFVIGTNLETYIYAMQDIQRNSMDETIKNNASTIIYEFTNLRKPEEDLPEEIVAQAREYISKKSLTKLRQWAENNHGELVIFDSPGVYEFTVPTLWDQLVAKIISGGAATFEGGAGKMINDIMPVSPGDTVIITVGNVGEKSSIQTPTQLKESSFGWDSEEEKLSYIWSPFGGIGEKGLVVFYG